MTVLFEKPEFVEVVVRGKRTWIETAHFDHLVWNRRVRIEGGARLNNGPLIHDQYADENTLLVPGGEVTVWEVSYWVNSERDMKKYFGKNWSEPLPGESRPNPRW